MLQGDVVKQGSNYPRSLDSWSTRFSLVHIQIYRRNLLHKSLDKLLDDIHDVK